MGEYDKLRKEFELKVKRLQASCEHKEVEWMDYMWAPGHFAGKVKVCLNCNKILEQKYPFEVKREVWRGGCGS